MINMSCAASQSHQNELAQLAYQSQRALQTQANEYANATERLKQEAARQAEHMNNYMSAKQTSEQNFTRAEHEQINNNARAAYEHLNERHAEMQQMFFRREAEVSQLQLSVKTAELTIAQTEADRVAKIASAYQNQRGTPGAPDSQDSGSRESAHAYLSPRGSVRSNQGYVASLSLAASAMNRVRGHMRSMGVQNCLQKP